MTTRTTNGPEHYWASTTDDELRTAADEYRQFADDEMLSSVADDIDAELERRRVARITTGERVRIRKTGAIATVTCRREAGPVGDPDARFCCHIAPCSVWMTADEIERAR